MPLHRGPHNPGYATDDDDDGPIEVTAIISGMGKAADFKFGRHIYRAHPNKTPLKIGQKGAGQKGAWAYPEAVTIFEYAPLLSQERVKLRTSNFPSTST